MNLKKHVELATLSTAYVPAILTKVLTKLKESLPCPAKKEFFATKQLLANGRPFIYTLKKG